MNNRFLTFFAIFSLIFFLTYNKNGAEDNTARKPINQTTWSDFYKSVQDGDIVSVQMQEGSKVIFATDVNDKVLKTLAPDDAKPSELFLNKGISVNVAPYFDPANTPLSKFFSFVMSLLPIFIFLAFYLFIMKKSMGNVFGAEKDHLVKPEDVKIRFNDVAGIGDVKEDLQETIEFLKNPEKYAEMGSKIPRGILLVGPPGTGKTMIAKATAGEAGVPFISMAGSEFIEMFVGLGARRVRKLFSQAKELGKCIIFIDEIDAIGKSRAGGMGGSNSEHEQTLNQLLVEMDGFGNRDGIIIIAATNRPETLDKALLRPGRFDRQLTVPLPDLQGRADILKVYLDKIKYDDTVDRMVIARGTPGFSGAELSNLINEATLLAVKNGRNYINYKDIEQSKDKILMGSEKKTLIMNDHEKKLTAYHEAGHAIVAVLEEASDPVHKATIVPRGRALGMVVRLPERDSISLPIKKIKADLAVAAAGRAAEYLAFGPDEVTTGASSDIKMATQYARAMVTEWGLSDKLGFVNYTNEKGGYLGQKNEIGDFSEKTAILIDEEVKRITDEAYERACNIIKNNYETFSRLAEELLEKETLTGDEIRSIISEGVKKSNQTVQSAEIGV